MAAAREREADAATADDASSSAQSVDVLSSIQGITANDIKRLKESGYCTLEAVAFAPKKSLVTVKGLETKKMLK